VSDVGLAWCAARELLDGGRLRSVPLDLSPLQPLQPCVDATPAGAHEVDEQGEIVDTRVALGQELAFESLEPADRLVQQAPDLRDVPTDGKHLESEPVTHRGTDLRRDRRLELGRRRGECFDLGVRALERGFERPGLGATPGGVCDPLLRSIQCKGVHGRRGYPQRRMDTALLDYHLPPELIAQHPLEPRDASRLLVYRRASRAIEHRVFSELPNLLEDELAVVNDTRVVPAKLRLRRATGGSVEVLLLEARDDGLWEALARPSRRLRVDEELGPVRLLEPLGEGRWLVRLEGEPAGEAPLPPYIHERLVDPERYQTVYAVSKGSAAAPTAGLHFTRSLLEKLDPARVTLHVGLDTFRPISTERLEEHELHGERYAVAPEAWARISGARRVLAVGTTTVRVLETVARTGELAGRTTLFVTPGFEFRRVDALLTNFHLPCSTLLALVMAFAGIAETRELYRVAVTERYRFYSFGDAMLVL